MTTLLARVVTSPVQIEDRKALGIKPGDTVRVHQKIVDKGKTRLQVFDGIVLARKHGDEAGATFTVRKMSQGIGVEKIFPLYTPLIEKIEILKRAKVRRAKLYYIREKVAREIKRQMRRMSLVSMTTEEEAEALARSEAEAKAVEVAAKAVEADALKADEVATPTKITSADVAIETQVTQENPTSVAESAGAQVETVGERKS